MTASVLSPQAAPFHPISFEPINLAVYNNGVPAAMFKRGSESDILHGIADETIDEAFPPTAEEAAELEAVELFVNLMANLAFMEDREEAARNGHAGLKKRWEARRKELAHPRPPKHAVNRVNHGGNPLLDHISSLVVYDHSHEVLENRMRAKENSRSSKPLSNKMMKTPKTFQKPIQQPRKKC